MNNERRKLLAEAKDLIEQAKDYSSRKEARRWKKTSATLKAQWTV